MAHDRIAVHTDGIRKKPSFLPVLERKRLTAEALAVRPRLLRLLAPAGYGKTTFALAFAHALGEVAVCDCLRVAAPSDIVRLMLEAIAETRPEAERLDIVNAFMSLGDDERAWLRYARDIVNRYPNPPVVVIDNGEALLDKPQARRLLEQVLYELDAEVTLVFCSRVDVAVRFARFAGPERTLRFDASDLRLSMEEIALLFASVRIGAAALAKVETFTRGWPMLVMLLYSLAKRERLDAYLADQSRAEAELYDYLVTEVLVTLGASERDLLEVASALPDARESDLVALFGDRTEATIDEVMSTTPFVTRSAAGSLAVHPAIADVLRSSSERGADLARQIAERLAPADPVRAARIFVHLDEFERAARLLEDARFWLRNPSSDLVDILCAVPSQTLLEFPAVWNVASFSRALSRDATEWLNEGERVYASLTESTPLDVRVELFSTMMNVYCQRGEFGKARTFSAAFARTEADNHPMGLVTIRHWELVEDCFLGRYVDRESAERELAPLLQMKMIEVLWDFDLFGRHERLAGHEKEERAMVARAVDTARTLGDHLLRYLTLTEAMFGSWFWGDDDRFEAYLAEFREASHPSTERGMSLFLAACDGTIDRAKPDTEQLKVRAYSYLIAAAKVRDSGKRRALLRAALSAADTSAQPFLATLVRVAIALSDRNAARRVFGEARELAATTWSLAFRAAVESVAHGELRGHMLESFAARYSISLMSSNAVANPNSVEVPLERRIVVSLARGSARVGTHDVDLSAREFELLVFLALRSGPASIDSVSEALWPDSDADRARASVKVTLSRLRARLGDPSLIVATKSGYAVAGAELDFVAWIDSDVREKSEARRLSPHDIEEARLRLSRWPWATRFERELGDLEAAIRAEP